MTCSAAATGGGIALLRTEAAKVLIQHLCQSEYEAVTTAGRRVAESSS